ncbi:hypothetical protein ACQP1P_15720 [Dactylosporangium sp. CA-052675]|uniref:hypothetical protein n=1 Tax=Dactylosporangium sp. CA-052675 TaxID=3239927 RepID=UPI003D947C1B
MLIVGARDGAVSYRPVAGTLPAGTHPDAAAARLAASLVGARREAVPAEQGGAQCDGPQPVWAPPPLTILHSTSWRYAGGAVVLTHVAVFDGRPEPDAVPLAPHGIAHSGDPTAPSPGEVSADAVAAHAVRHLAWLRGGDEVVVAATALAGHPQLWRALNGYAPTLAGGLGIKEPDPVVLAGLRAT